MKIKFSNPIQAMWGKLDGLIYRRIHTGEVIVSASPDMSGVIWSEAQQAHRRRFKEAVVQAKAALTDPEVRARYEAEAAARGMRPFDFAVSDCYKRLKQMTEG